MIGRARITNLVNDHPRQVVRRDLELQGRERVAVVPMGEWIVSEVLAPGLIETFQRLVLISGIFSGRGSVDDVFVEGTAGGIKDLVKEIRQRVVSLPGSEHGVLW
ncbi:hypothetical protein JB92DRAFT_2826481 [Gautieria morchelliformis]|nr:hypothetical protein JB92DRAFT_2826481 [Gautieria morchelliformis]